MDSVSGIGVLDKMMALLDAVRPEPLSLRELVERTGISRATTHRLAQALEQVGMIRRTEDGAYALGLVLIGLGRATVEGFPLTAAAVPVLERLRDDTGESAQLFVIAGSERLCVAAADSLQELRTSLPVGTRLPLDLGSAGRALVGAEVGVGGWVASVAERAPGVASVSAPVRDGATLVAAVSVSGPIERVTIDPGSRFGSRVVAAAAAIEAAIAP